MNDEETARAMREQAREPLLPAEKQLIGASLALGVLLLGVLYWVTKTQF